MSKITQVGVTVAAGGTASAAATIPTSQGGSPTRYVRVVTDGTAAFIKFGGSSVAATTGDIMITQNPSVFNVWNVGGYYSVIKDGSNTANVNIVPCENA